MGWWRLVSGAVALVLMSVLPHPAAGAPMSDAGPLLQEMGRQLEDQSRPAAERLQIIKVFGDWPSAQVRPPLMTALKDPQPAIREAAAGALGWQGNTEAVPALRERAANPDEAAAVRAAAVRSLGRIGDHSARAFVVSLARDPDPGIREAAVWSVALGLLVDPADQTSYLVQFAEDRAADPALRVEAIRTLATKGKEEPVVASLSRLLEHEPRLTVALPPGQPTQEQIMSLRFVQARDIAAWAAGMLGQIEAKTALPLLLRSAEDPNDFFLRMMSVESLVAWNAHEAFPVFVSRLDDPLPEIRVLALLGLARFGDPKVVDPLLAHLSDENPSVRARLVAVLAKLGDPKVRPELEALDKRETDPVVLRALEAALSQAAH